MKTVIVKLVSGETLYSGPLDQGPGEILQTVRQVMTTSATAGSQLSLPEGQKRMLVIPRDQIRYVEVVDSDQVVIADVNVD